ncbi:hypothetical protein K466DRAFT_122404 [Polyporus arcularius HHB13444]|uniref:DUF6533 domain-containing protein n=1 Tax=Polyporus arcularius HHB13444 TaxID=1314778 RepID=A0A5C3Q4N1_9APHY|nr:hypothetical protein K466DRAFT_122404 [Polyporus arcularius HHB13444]
MSSDADADAAVAAVALVDSIYTDHYCDLAASVLFMYDACITLDREVACFWTAKRTGPAFLFFANKCISMAVYLMVFISFASSPSDKRFVRSLAGWRWFVDVRRCSLIVISIQAMLTLQFVPGAAFSALRAYVFSRSKPLGLLVFASSLAPVGANLVIYAYQYSGVTFPPFGCISTDNTTVALDLRSAIVLISRVPLIAADLVLIYITWHKLSSWHALRDIRHSKRLALSDVLFRGGTVYFVILFILNILHLVLSATAVAGDGEDWGSLITQFTGPITAILISRFLLELQEADQIVLRLDPDDPLHSSRNAWDSGPSFLSSLGGFVDPALSARFEDGGGFEVQDRSGSEGEAAASSTSTA